MSKSMRCGTFRMLKSHNNYIICRSNPAAEQPSEPKYIIYPAVILSSSSPLQLSTLGNKVTQRRTELTQLKQ
eukprot:scaffold12252_cov133-Skeletonema_dohrnii-CCMP3373.AAC.4